VFADDLTWTLAQHVRIWRDGWTCRRVRAFHLHRAATTLTTALLFRAPHGAVGQAANTGFIALHALLTACCFHRPRRHHSARTAGYMDGILYAARATRGTPPPLHTARV